MDCAVKYYLFKCLNRSRVLTKDDDKDLQYDDDEHKYKVDVEHPSVTSHSTTAAKQANQEEQDS